MKKTILIVTVATIAVGLMLMTMPGIAFGYGYEVQIVDMDHMVIVEQVQTTQGVVPDQVIPDGGSSGGTDQETPPGGGELDGGDEQTPPGGGESSGDEESNPPSGSDSGTPTLPQTGGNTIVYIGLGLGLTMIGTAGLARGLKKERK